MKDDSPSGGSLVLVGQCFDFHFESEKRVFLPIVAVPKQSETDNNKSEMSLWN